MRIAIALASLAWLAVGSAGATGAIEGGGAARPPSVIANDNRAAAGVLKDGALELKLEIVTGNWHPEDENGTGLVMQVFAEEGKPPLNPGPLIRVPRGARIHVSIHNLLDKPAVVHGFHARPGHDESPLDIPAGSTRAATFSAGAPGTYYYWATTTGAKDYGARGANGADSQLAGAFVVDPPGGAPLDRIFVLGLVDLLEDPFHAELGTFVINGKSWPYTEHLTYRTGEHARWRWINVSTTIHPMHLHGAYFDVVAAGDGEREDTYRDADTRRVVTEAFADGATMTVDWVPEREGRWIFHCHLAPHFAPDNELPRVTYPESWGPPLASPPAPASAHLGHAGMDPASAGMGGLVMGITVLPGAATPARTPSVPSAPLRKLEVIAQPRAHGAGNTATFGYVVRDSGRELPPFDALISPPIVLTQDQPVEITIVNRLASPTAVHWHGIELDSYYDGVAGWGGNASQITPPVQPGSSFVARFTPPRAGTFIYHTHWHDPLQLAKGLYGPLIVLPPGERFDPDGDRIVLISSDAPEQTDDFLVNGTLVPAPQGMRVGQRYRLRFINMTADNPGMVATIFDGATRAEWRAIAKDGADLPESQRVRKAASQRVSVGETYDFEFSPPHAGQLRLDVFRPVDKRHIVVTIDVQ